MKKYTRFCSHLYITFYINMRPIVKTAKHIDIAYSLYAYTVRKKPG